MELTTIPLTLQFMKLQMWNLFIMHQTAQPAPITKRVGDEETFSFRCERKTTNEEKP